MSTKKEANTTHSKMMNILNHRRTEVITFQYLHWRCPLLSVEEKEIALSRTKDFLGALIVMVSAVKKSQKQTTIVCNSEEKEMEHSSHFLAKCYFTMKITFKATGICT